MGLAVPSCGDKIDIVNVPIKEYLLFLWTEI